MLFSVDYQIVFKRLIKHLISASRKSIDVLL